MIMSILVLITVNNTYPQSTYFTLIEDDKIHKPWDILIKPDGTMLFCSYYLREDESWSTMYELNSLGIIVNEWTFTNSGTEWFENTRIIRADNHIYLFGKGKYDNQGSQIPFISMRMFDLQLNEIKNYSYRITGLPYNEIIPNRVILKDSLIYLFGALNNLPNWIGAYFYNISTSGQEISCGYYETDEVIFPFDFYINSSTNHRCWLGWEASSSDPVWGTFYEIDSNINLINKFNLPDFSMFNYTCLEETDTTFFVAGNQWDITTYPNENFNSIVYKIDLNGNLLNQFVFKSPEVSPSHVAHFNALDTLADGNLIMCSTWNLDNELSVQPEPTKIMLFKLTPDLELIWQKYLFGDDGMYEAYSMQAHPDGGIVILGTYSPTPPSSDIKNIFFLKTNSDGILTGIDENREKIRISDAILYPNPASEQVTVEFSMAYPLAEFQMTDISGKTVLKTHLSTNRQTVDISAIPAGTYIYRISNPKGLEESGKLVVE